MRVEGLETRYQILMLRSDDPAVWKAQEALHPWITSKPEETTMALSVKLIRGANLQVENDKGNWLMFTLDELRSRSAVLRLDRIEGAPKLSEKDGDLFVWAAFAAARGYAIEHGLIESA